MKKTWIVFALMACLSFAACGNGGGSSDDGDNGGSEAVNPGVGTWVLDTEAALKAMDEKLAAEPNPMGEMMKGMIKNMKVEMVLAKDGTYVANVEMQNPMSGEHEKTVAKGTWTLEGEVFTITTTEENGVVDETPKVQTATFKDGMIYLTPEGAPFTMVFKKK